MDFVKYRYIIAAAGLRSISKAAGKCSISLPALTRRINKIEAELEVKLSDRSTRQIRLETEPFLCTLYDPPAERALAASYKKVSSSHRLPDILYTQSNIRP